MSVLIFKLVASATLSLAGAALLAVIRHWFKQRNLQKIPGPSNPSLIWGHWHHMSNAYSHLFYEELFETFGKVARVYGFLGGIQLIVSDPKACNNIIVKDQAIFEETEAFSTWHGQTFGPGIFATLGTHHRKQRKLLNPVFNVNHMRYMIPIFHKVTRQVCENLESVVANGPQEINLIEWVGKLALELIGQAGLGYSFGILEGRSDEFRRGLKEWGPASSTLKVHRNFFPYARKIFPNNVLKFVGRMLPWPKLHHVMDLVVTLNANVRAVYETKKILLETGDDATARQVGDGKDIISLLMQANLDISEEDRMSEEEVLAQMIMIVLTASETTSSAVARVLHLLALHPDAQDKLRKELRDACQDNEELTHDQLVSLPFLEAVCRESLRVYPPTPGVMRTARSDVVVPLSAPIRDVDRREIHEVFIPENTNVFVQIKNLNCDPSIWGPDAAEWKPERWLVPLPESVAEANIQGVYANTMTFIGGPRSCLGVKFSQLEMKVVLSQIIPAFQLSPTKAEVIWRFGSISTPSVKGSVGKLYPELPIVISRVLE